MEGEGDNMKGVQTAFPLSPSLNSLPVTRVVSGIVLFIFFASVIAIGGDVYFVVFSLLLALIAIEICSLAEHDGYRPAVVLSVAGVALIVVDARWPQLDLLRPGLVALLLTSLTWHLIAFERGAERPLFAWALTVLAGIYPGLLGVHLLLLREGTGLVGLPRSEGLWWTALTIACVALADVGAYFVGRAAGHARLAPRLSPHKTWAGYIGGLLCSGIAGAVVGAVLHTIIPGDNSLTLLHGLALGLLIGSLCPLGDLGESLVKRQLSAKDSGHLIPGHGGIFDRLDSWLWGGVIAYYYLVLFVH